MEGYSDWICLVAEFTLKSLQSWQVTCYVVCNYSKNALNWKYLGFYGKEYPGFIIVIVKIIFAVCMHN